MAFSILKNKNKDNSPKLVSKLSFKQGALMWGILIAGYILFVVNWLLLGRLAGSGGENPGWTQYFFGSDTPATVLTQAINYTITFMRGIGSLIVGWLIVKLTHKWAVVVSMILVLMAIPAILMPGSVGGFAGFIIFRMLLAIGGTTLIIYIQPVMAKSMNTKQKGIFSVISPFGFNLATVIAVAPFLTLGVSLQENWQIVAGIAAGVAFVPLILYLIFGKNFDTNTQAQDNGLEKEEKLPSSSLKILKEKQTWVWVVVYGAWLVIAVIPITGLFKGALSALAISSNLGLSAADIAFAHNIFTILFVLGVFLSPFTIGRWNITTARRKPFIIFIGIMILFAFAFLILGWSFGSIATFYVFGFIAGWLTWSIQGVILNNPHERKGNTPKRIGTLFGFIWGFGYFFYTISNIILAAIVPDSTNLSLQIGFLAVFFIISSLFAIGFIFVKETKPDGKIIPEGLKFWKKMKNK